MTSRPRQSRRSACDRCRMYKLRCERPPVPGGSCDRCTGLDIICTTTTSKRLSNVGPLRSPINSVHERTTSGSGYPIVTIGRGDPQRASQSSQTSAIESQTISEVDMGSPVHVSLKVDMCTILFFFFLPSFRALPRLIPSLS